MTPRGQLPGLELFPFGATGWAVAGGHLIHARKAVRAYLEARVHAGALGGHGFLFFILFMGQSREQEGLRQFQIDFW